ncbi:MAG: hypothetical protein N0E55_03715, partial [Candidatus Thiodiazotropha taylori]|nr:hypothetical protein [Candidatus Thiodiazotropha taylori]MCW4251796.1 hypothetical protein [Candidatus Thiodiazotropha taylori]
RAALLQDSCPGLLDTIVEGYQFAPDQVVASEASIDIAQQMRIAGDLGAAMPLQEILDTCFQQAVLVIGQGHVRAEVMGQQTVEVVVGKLDTTAGRQQ